ncbi:Protein roadkill, partial [Stegodyphus mimosarum]
MEKQEDDKFTFTWSIENFSMCHHSKVECLFSPEFALNSLPGMKWFIQLYPRGVLDEDCIIFFLSRTDNILKSWKISYRFKVLDCNEKLLFSLDEETNIFECKLSSNPYCLQRKLPFPSLVNDILIIKCTLKPVCEPNVKEELLPVLYENRLFTDVVLRTNDSAFKVHKVILYARWPKLAEILEAKGDSELALGIESNVLDAMIRYVYTGRIDVSGYEFLAEVSSIATKYEFPHPISTPVVAQKYRTKVDVEKMSFVWPIKNFSSLPVNTVLRSHVFTVNILKSCKWNLKFEMCKDALHGRIFDIFICKVCDQNSRPIFIRSKISFNGNSSENHYLFEEDEMCKYVAEFSRCISTHQNDVLFLECELIFSEFCEFLDCNYASNIVESSCAFTLTIYCHHFSSDLLRLYESGKSSDVTIVVGSRTFLAHKFIICARSCVFSKMFETEMEEKKKNSVTISDVKPHIIDEMLRFMYSGTLKKSLNGTAMKLYAAADKYDVQALKKVCLGYLKSNLSVNNVFKVFQVADLHSDNDLCESAFEYINLHKEVVFSSNKWKQISSRSLHKLLEKMEIQ